MTQDQWFAAIRRAVGHIADTAYQQRSWSGRGPEVSSPDELYNELFDEALVDDFMASDLIVLRPVQREALKRLVQKLNEIANDYPNGFDVGSLLMDAKWHEATRLAQEVYTLLLIE